MAPLSQPFTAAQWEAIVNSKDNDPALDPATAPARKDPKWEKYWNIRYSILGSFKTPEEQAKIPYAGPIDGGGDPDTQYLFVQLSRPVRTGLRDPRQDADVPRHLFRRGGTRARDHAGGADPVLLGGQREAAPSGQIVDGLTDMQVPLDADGNYTIVYSRAEDRPANATAENGVAWIEWSPRGEGIDGPGNRDRFRHADDARSWRPTPDWAESPLNVTGRARRKR